ncbi:alpha/beta hydrolase [Saccharopolyspora sp. NFXS83]|uniref:alpha/beta hydrolase n=1 Tax=Saccharopolyspora sp. NFXS83 TaxID=2993560 RepID=UPI003A4E62E3
MRSSRWFRRPVTWSVVVSTALLAGSVAAPPLAAERGSPPSAAVADGARVLQENRLDDRTVDLLIYSPALGTSAPVRLLLPEGWTRNPDRTWPVLYLLHGCCEDADYRAWTEFTDVREFMADKDVLTVIPSGGPAGFYTRWTNFGAGAPDWEAFHLRELRGILERDYGAGQRRAVAGLSIGGYGAFAYAFRNPGLFRAAASFSGLLNTLQPAVPGVIKGILVREGENPFAMWGDEVLDHRTWSERNPFDHAEALRGTALWVSCGNGLPGPLDEPGSLPDPLEPAALSTSQVMTSRLKDLGIPVTEDFYGPGLHDWPYWERELHRAWPMFAERLGVERSGASANAVATAPMSTSTAAIRIPAE